MLKMTTTQCVRQVLWMRVAVVSMAAEVSATGPSLILRPWRIDPTAVITSDALVNVSNLARFSAQDSSDGTSASPSLLWTLEVA